MDARHSMPHSERLGSEVIGPAAMRERSGSLGAIVGQQDRASRSSSATPSCAIAVS